VEDRDNIVAVVDIEALTHLSVDASIEYDRFKEVRQMRAFIRATDYNLDKTGYNIIVPSVGEFKITAFLQKQANAGDFKPKYRYQLTLEG
jgi:hypothetical protein